MNMRRWSDGSGDKNNKGKEKQLSHFNPLKREFQTGSDSKGQHELSPQQEVEILKSRFVNQKLHPEDTLTSKEKEDFTKIVKGCSPDIYEDILHSSNQIQGHIKIIKKHFKENYLEDKELIDEKLKEYNRNVRIFNQTSDVKHAVYAKLNLESIRIKVANIHTKHHENLPNSQKE